MAEVPEAEWRRSSLCANESCVEVALLEGHAALRDAKERHGPVLQFDRTAWTEFLDGVRNGEFDLPPGRPSA